MSVTVKFAIQLAMRDLTMLNVREPTWKVVRAGHKQPEIGVILLNVDGGESPGLHESIGLECVASVIMRELRDVELMVGDLQFDILDGSLDLGLVASEIIQYLHAAPEKTLIGLGVPIYGWDNARELIRRVSGAAVGSDIYWVLGNAIPTYTRPELLQSQLPANATIVQGDGETGILPVLRALREGRQPPALVPFRFLPADEYESPLRVFTHGVMERGGAPKMEASRGCDWGHCTFCSRCGHRGGDYRSFSAVTIVTQMQQIIGDFGPTRFEFADEEAFGDKEATEELVTLLEERALPATFMASLRVPTFLERVQDGLMPRLVKAGLEKVFLGVEGGADSYLKLMAKGQHVSDVQAAVKAIEENSLDLEMGFITFSWRMTYPMLVGNTIFLRTYHPYISWLFNNLEVRAGTADETLLWQYHEKGMLGDYDPAEKFSINDSVYRGVPFLDDRVAIALAEAEKFADDLRPQYSLKSLVRAKSLVSSQAVDVEHIYSELQRLHFLALDDIVNNGSREVSELRARRIALFERASQALRQPAMDNKLANMALSELTAYLRACPV